MDPVLGIVIAIGLLVIEGLLFSCSIVTRNEKIENLNSEIKIKDRKIVEKSETIFKRDNEIDVLRGTIVRMKENTEKLSRNNEFLQKEINAYKNAPMKIETFMVQPVELTRDVQVDSSFFLNVPDAKKQLMHKVAEDFAWGILNDYNTYKLEVERSFTNPDMTTYRFKIRVCPYNHNIDYDAEGYFSGRMY